MHAVFCANTHREHRIPLSFSSVCAWTDTYMQNCQNKSNVISNALILMKSKWFTLLILPVPPNQLIVFPFPHTKKVTLNKYFFEPFLGCLYTSPRNWVSTISRCPRQYVVKRILINLCKDSYSEWVYCFLNYGWQLLPSGPPDSFINSPITIWKRRYCTLVFCTPNLIKNRCPNNRLWFSPNPHSWLFPELFSRGGFKILSICINGYWYGY